MRTEEKKETGMIPAENTYAVVSHDFGVTSIHKVWGFHYETEPDTTMRGEIWKRLKPAVGSFTGGVEFAESDIERIHYVGTYEECEIFKKHFNRIFNAYCEKHCDEKGEVRIRGGVFVYINMDAEQAMVREKEGVVE